MKVWFSIVAAVASFAFNDCLVEGALRGARNNDNEAERKLIYVDQMWGGSMGGEAGSPNMAQMWNGMGGGNGGGSGGTGMTVATEEIYSEVQETKDNKEVTHVRDVQTYSTESGNKVIEIASYDEGN